MQPVHGFLIYAKKLKDAGEPEKLAEIHAEGLATAIENSDLVTKKELAHQVDRLEAKITGLDTKVMAIDTKFTEKFNLLYWMIGFLIMMQCTLFFKVFCH